LPFSFPSQVRIEVHRVGSAPCFNALLACTTCRIEIEIEIDSPMAESESECTLLVVVVVIVVVVAFIVLSPAHFEFVEGKTVACVSEMMMQ